MMNGHMTFDPITSSWLAYNKTLTTLGSGADILTLSW